MKIQITRPNFDVVVNELINGLASENNLYATSFPVKRTSILKEFRTIRLGSGRQAGHSTWLVNKLVSDPDNCVLFMKDMHLVNSHYRSWLGSQTTDGSMTPELKALADKVVQRILPQRIMKGPYNPDNEFFQTPVMKKAPKYIMIDEAVYHVHFFIGVLYEWIAATADKDPVIILMN